MGKNQELKKLRKEIRRTNVQSINLFWDTVAQMTFQQRCKLVLKILKHPQIKVMPK